MFNFSEIIFIAALALILIGPRQLPEVARNIGRLLNEFRRASDSVFKDITKEVTSTSTTSEEIKKKDESKS